MTPATTGSGGVDSTARFSLSAQGESVVSAKVRATATAVGSAPRLSFAGAVDAGGAGAMASEGSGEGVDVALASSTAEETEVTKVMLTAGVGLRHPKSVGKRWFANQ